MADRKVIQSLTYTVLCATVLSLVLPVAAQNIRPVRGDKQEQYTESETSKGGDGRQCSPIVTDLDKENATNEQRYAYYKAHPREYFHAAIAPTNASNWILAVLGIFGAIVGIGTLCVVGKQVGNTIRSDRAWLIVEKAELVEGKPGTPGKVFVQCAVKNFGKTVARVLGMNARWGIGPIDDPGATWDESLLEFDKNVAHRW